MGKTNIIKIATRFGGVLAVAAFAGCATENSVQKYSGISPKEVTVTVTCSDPNTRFGGTIITDGQAEHWIGIGSATFHASGHNIMCQFRKTADAGRLSLAVSRAGVPLGDSSTDDKFGGVRAELVSASPQESVLFTTY
jgi:hypothetical protein